ncbi:ABC transporter permease subunit [Paenibacillus roseipurpureus]|uniref:ABC transporter permease subunit n=1 Tax=Paenibacillus roseopurpureus TaxID=2918901 RepID=UPI0028E3CD54|nr:ABC transporter permease subunit [Paenibacillus sp. MBLB1832]
MSCWRFCASISNLAFFFDLPQEVLESASIDGCSKMRIFWKIVLPNPMMFVFPFFQKYFVRGITFGAVKR